jgi:glycosyltransferase involved in cell wall biosynthesis
MPSLMRRLGRKVKRTLFPPVRVVPADSIDRAPWDHPFLTPQNLRRFREYSGGVWDFARDYQSRRPDPLDIGYCVNLVQHAYNWACLAQQRGARATLYPHPLDRNALSLPEWEDFDGEYPDVHDGAGFLAAQGGKALRCPCVRLTLERDSFDAAAGHSGTGDRRPLHGPLGVPPRHVRLEPFLVHREFATYFPWARALAAHDALVSPSNPIPAYLSGRPYLAPSTGGDLQFDCGRSDDYGLLMTLAFAAARFITLPNPHTVGMCRRLGFTNGLYLPLAIDTERYSPGEGRARREWEAEHGPGVYVLSASRIDNAVKGNGAALLAALIRAARQRPALRYVFLNWGHSAQEFVGQVSASGAASQFVFRKPVGKARLIDYYRSSDAVMDQFVYGYYGSAGLEAAAVGKPILMRIREEQSGPLYEGDIPPVVNLPDADALERALVRLADEPDWHRERGRQTRDWLVRNHGAQRVMPVHLALLRLAADGVQIPADLARTNPLTDPETDAERAHHANCLQPRPDLIRRT